MIQTYEVITGTLHTNWTTKVTAGLLLQLCSKEITKTENMRIFLTCQVIVIDTERYF